MTTYVARAPRPKLIQAEDEWFEMERRTLDVVVADDTPQSTGLVDQHGNALFRLTERGPVGFCR